MKFIRSIESVGEYALLMKRVLSVPDRMREFVKEFLKGVYSLGVNSIWIVIIISFFIGAVIVLQIALNVDSPMLPRFTVGVVSREIILLEFSSTIMCLILSGKVGSNVASEIGRCASRSRLTRWDHGCELRELLDISQDCLFRGVHARAGNL